MFNACLVDRLANMVEAACGNRLTGMMIRMIVMMIRMIMMMIEMIMKMIWMIVMMMINGF